MLRSWSLDTYWNFLVVVGSVSNSILKALLNS